MQTVPATTDHDPYNPHAAVLIPLGAGLCATIHGEPGSGPSGTVSNGDLAAMGTTAARLWQDAATDMLTVLGRTTARHGTALRHRDTGDGVREIAVIDTPFPAAGLVAHPLLAVPTHRILGCLPGGLADAAVYITGDQRLLVTHRLHPGLCADLVADSISGPLDLSAGHCQRMRIESTV